MARELHTIKYKTIIDGKEQSCVHYASIETMADPVYDQKYIVKLRQLTGLPIISYTFFKGYVPAEVLTAYENPTKSKEIG